MSDNNYVSKWQNTRKAIVNKYHTHTHYWKYVQCISRYHNDYSFDCKCELEAKHKLWSILWKMLSSQTDRSSWAKTGMLENRTAVENSTW